MIANYNKTKKIVWTPEADACFDLVKLETSKCTIMHFLDDHAPISLQTDASDYGVGGYLVALYSAYRTYVPYRSCAFPDLEPRYRSRRHFVSCITSLSLFARVAILAFVAC